MQRQFLRLFSTYRDMEAAVAEATFQRAIWQDRVDEADREKTWLRTLVEESRKSENYARESMANFTAQMANGVIPYPNAAQLPPHQVPLSDPGPGGVEYMSPVAVMARARKIFVDKCAAKFEKQ